MVIHEGTLVLLGEKVAFSCGVEVADGKTEVHDALVENDHLEIFHQSDEEGMAHHPGVYPGGGVGETGHPLEVYRDDVEGTD